MKKLRDLIATAIIISFIVSKQKRTRMSGPSTNRIQGQTNF